MPCGVRTFLPRQRRGRPSGPLPQKSISARLTSDPQTRIITALPLRTAEYLARPPLSDGRIAGYDPESATALVHHKGLRPYWPKVSAGPGVLRPAGSMLASLQTALATAAPDARGMLHLSHDEIWNAEELLARWLQHVPARGQRYVHYQGLYSTRTRWRFHRRGWRFRLTATGRSAHEFGRHAWADLLWRGFQVDPLRCPSCGWTLVLVDLVIPGQSRPPPG